MYYAEDNEYSDEEEEYGDIPDDVLDDLEYLNKILIINKFKKYIKHEPEFIGIKNICSSKILNIIEYTYYDITEKNDYNLTYNQKMLFDNLYKELYNKTCEISIYNSVIKNIFRSIYI